MLLRASGDDGVYIRRWLPPGQRGHRYSVIWVPPKEDDSEEAADDQDYSKRVGFYVAQPAWVPEWAKRLPAAAWKTIASWNAATLTTKCSAPVTYPDLTQT